MTEGLPGPPIDTGSDPIERRVILPRWLKAMVAFSAVLAAGAILISVSLFASNQEAAMSAKALAVSIQQSRRDAYRVGCEETNRRHDDALRTLDEVIAKQPPGPGRVNAIADRPVRRGVIKALVPKRDCDGLVRDATRLEP